MALLGLHGRKALIVERVADHAHRMLDVVFHDFVAQSSYLHAGQAQAIIDVGVFPSRPREFGIETVDFFEVGFPGGKIRAENSAIAGLVGHRQHDAVLDEPGPAAQPQAEQAQRAERQPAAAKSAPRLGTSCRWTFTLRHARTPPGSR